MAYFSNISHSPKVVSSRVDSAARVFWNWVGLCNCLGFLLMISRWLKWFQELYFHMKMSKAGTRWEALPLCSFAFPPRGKYYLEAPSRCQFRSHWPELGCMSTSKPITGKETWHYGCIIVHPQWLGKGSTPPHIWTNQSIVSNEECRGR